MYVNNYDLSDDIHHENNKKIRTIPENILWLAVIEQAVADVHDYYTLIKENREILQYSQLYISQVVYRDAKQSYRWIHSKKYCENDPYSFLWAAHNAQTDQDDINALIDMVRWRTRFPINPL